MPGSALRRASSDGEAFGKRLMDAPTFAAFLPQADQLSKNKVIRYHAIGDLDGLAV